jgi:voltage-gated potassium channel
MDRPEDRQLAQIRRQIVRAGGALLVVCLVGTVGFTILGEGQHGVLDALYMTVITVTTVGYGEIIPLDTHPMGRVFTMALLLFGAGIIVYFASSVTALLVEGQLKNVFWRRRMRKAIAELQGHFIVCGAGSVAAHVLEELRRVQRPVVAIVPPGMSADLLGDAEALLLVEGDPAEEDVLREAGVQAAAGLVPALEHDRDNVLVTLTARQLNPALRIVAMVTDARNTSKLERAGADAVVNPPLIGGLRLASTLIRPTVVTFLDTMLRDRERNLRVEEVAVGPGSSAIGRRLGDLGVNEVPGVLLLALAAPGGAWSFKPDDATVVQEGATLIVMGGPEGAAELRRRFGSPAPVSAPVR